MKGDRPDPKAFQHFSVALHGVLQENKKQFGQAVTA